MKLVKRNNNEITEIKTITNISDLENHELVLIERGDSLKKQLKNGRTMFGNKNLYSVKSMKEALEENTKKAAKKETFTGSYCCVCGEHWTTNKNGICNECHM